MFVINMLCVTGKVALDELRFDIGSYYSSEIDNDALLVTSVQHVQQIKQLGDITKLGVAEVVYSLHNHLASVQIVCHVFIIMYRYFGNKTL